MLKSYLLIIAGLMTTIVTSAQQKIKDGAGAVAPKVGAILELESSDKALLLSRVALTNTTTWGLAGTAPTEGGYTVYNTNATITSTDAAYPTIMGGVGIYYWNGTGWVSLKADNREPWYVQNTSNPADSNTQNIYQSGKVAVGFTNTDIVSGKQLEVKGSFKTETVPSGGRISGMETDFFNIPGFIGLYNLDTTFFSSPFSSEGSLMLLGQNNTSIAAYGPSKVGQVAVGADIVLLQSGLSGAADGAAFVNMNKNEIGLNVENASGYGTKVRFKKELGVSFRHNNATGALTGEYTFPRTAGTVGQVLSVATNTADVSTLDWVTPTTLEPWNIAGTTNPADSNTQDIYQMGKVGIGTNNPITRLDVRGAIRVGIPHADEVSGTSAIGTNSIAVGEYNRVTGVRSTAFGDHNQVSGVLSGAMGEYNEIGGAGNFSVGAYNKYTGTGRGFNGIFGRGNELDNTNYSLVGGYQNIVTQGTNTVHGHLIGGLGNTVTTSGGNLVSGAGNNITSANYSVIGGRNNTLNAAAYSVALGYDNTITLPAINSYEHGYAIGTNLTVNNGKSMALGSDVTTTKERQLVLGFTNGVRVVGGVQEFPNNAAAVAAGLEVGTIYRTGDVMKIVH